MRFYIGSYTRLGGPGIAVCSLHGGRMTVESAAREIEDPIWVSLSRDRKTLYAVGSDTLGEGVVAGYRVEDGRLSLLSRQHTGGRAVCHLTLSWDERYLYAANYLSGSISVFPVQEGRLGKCIQYVQHTGSGPHPKRQEAAHTHQCLFRPGKNELFVCDLGIDQVMVYRQDAASGLLSLKEKILMPAGMGPRHLAFADENCFYVTGELDNVVRRCVQKKGVWQIDGAISTLPKDYEGNNLSAAIRLHAGALYVTNRGHDSLCRIALDEKGAMTQAAWTATGGQYPRDFAFAGKEIIFAHQNGGGVALLGGAALAMDGAVCVCVEHTTE